MRILDAIRSSAVLLEEAGIDDPIADAEILVLHAAGMDRIAAYTGNPEVNRPLLLKIRRLVMRRSKGEPLQYITGHVEFCGLTIQVGKGVLIPRPETELLVEEALAVLGGENSAFGRRPEAVCQILDVCSGSGCITLALAKAFPYAELCGTDISDSAIRYAKKNALLNKIGNVIFLRGSLFSPIKKGALFDLIVSNPPYVKTPEIGGLQREIREWEPLNALDGGADGLNFYRRIFPESLDYLKNKGKVIVELGFGQAEEVVEIAREFGFRRVILRKDYSGIDRILKAER